MAPAVEAFVRAVRFSLKPGPSRSDRVAAEIRDHLESAAEALRAEGYTADEAAQEALGRFGSPDELIRHMAEADLACAALDRRLTRRHLALAAVTSAAALAIIVRALDGGFDFSRPVILSSGTALVILLHGAYGLLRPYSVFNCVAGPAVALLGVFVMVCHGLFAKSIGMEYDAIALGLGVVVLLQGSLSAIAAYEIMATRPFAAS
ncbi:MAG: permease prefix domain 1-containing protein [Acidobacteriota bacterium]